MSLAGLDLTDPWGYSFRSDSPYDALLPPPTMPVQKPRALGDRRGTSSSIRSASHSSMSYIPEQSQYEEEPQQVYRESPADSQLHSSSSAISLDGHLSKSSDGRSAPSSALGVGRKRVASTSDVPHSVNAFGLNRPAALPSKLNHVSVSLHLLPLYVEFPTEIISQNHHDAKTTNTATNKEIAKQQRKFSWFRSRASRGDLGIVRTSTASSSKPSLFADDTASSVSMRTTTSSLRSAATGNTPPLSLSTSSAASSSIDTNLETNSTAASFVSTSDRSSPPLSAELVAPQPYSMYTSSKIIADHQKELGQSVSSTQTVTSAHQQRKSKLSRRSSPNLAAAKTQGQEEQTQTSKSRRISLVASAFSRKPKKLAVPQSPLPPYASDEDDADSTPTAGQGAVVLPADLPLPSVDADPRPISSQPSIPISQSLEHPPVVSHRTAIQMALAEMPTAVKRSASPSSKLLPNPAPDAATTTAALLQTISTLSTSPSGSASADNVTLCDGPARQVQVRTSSASLREPNVQPTVTVASTAEASPLLDWPGELPYSPRVDSPQICSA